MKNYAQPAAIVAIAAIAVFFLTARGTMSTPEEQQPKASNPEPTSDKHGMFLDVAHDSFGGVYESEGFKIEWAGTLAKHAGHGTEPSKVLEAVIHRLEFEQGSPLASDAKARALTELMKASALLAGEQIEADDGNTVIR